MRLSNDKLNQIIDEVWSDDYIFKSIGEAVDHHMQAMVDATTGKIVQDKALAIMFPWDWPER